MTRPVTYPYRLTNQTANPVTIRGIGLDANGTRDITKSKYDEIQEEVGFANITSVVTVAAISTEAGPDISEGAKALGVFRMSGSPTDEDTVTIGDDTYEFITSATADKTDDDYIRVALTGTNDSTYAAAALAAAIAASATEAVTAVDTSASVGGTYTGEVTVISDAVGVVTETLDASMTATTANKWDTTAMRVGELAAQADMYAVARVPNAVEVLQGRIQVPVDFTPTAVFVNARVTATGAAKAWDGAVNIDGTNNIVTLDNSGSTDFAATDTLYILLVQ